MRLRSLSLVSLFALGSSPLVWTAGCGSADDAFTARTVDVDAGTGGGGASTGSGGRAAGGRTSGGGASAGGRTSGGGASAGGTGSGTGGASAGGTGSGGTAGAGSGGTAGAGSGGTAGAGAGGADGGVTCPDADADGETTCAGDCDDGDPNNFTGNSEYCGDVQDNDCDTQVDEGCGGIGTYVSNIGNDSDPGTQALPVRTIAQGIANAQTIGGNTPVFIAGGHYSEKVTLVEGIDLLGGYLCDNTACTWARDIAANDSAILNTDAEGLLATDSITRATRIEGLRIQGQDGAGTGRGRVAVTLRGGSPTLTNDRINGPNVTSGGFLVGRSIGLLILSPSNSNQGPLVEGCTIQGGQATDASQGILMESTGGGQGNTYAHIRNNTIRGGQGTGSSALTAWTSGAGTLVEQNDISAGTSTSGSGSSFGITVGSQMTIDANRINVGSGAGSCPSGSTALCGGITSFSSTTTITNNVVFGMNAPLSVGVRLMEAEMPSGVVILNGNTIDGGGSSSGGSRSAAVVVQIGSCTGCGFRGYVGRIRNNVLLGGTANERFALYEEAPAGRTQHPEFLENNDLFVAPPLVGNDGLYRYYDGATATSLTTLGAVNGLAAQVPAMTVGANLSADPLLNATFHLRAGSTCANAGTATEAPATDMDGEVRPRGAGVDIGADEAR